MRKRLDSQFNLWYNKIYGRVPEWPKGADCKSVALSFGGSNPPSPTNNINIIFLMGEFPSGQRGQTVNLLRLASVVRIHPLPPNNMSVVLSIK